MNCGFSIYCKLNHLEYVLVYRPKGEYIPMSKICECGCGQSFIPAKGTANPRFVRGHGGRLASKKEHANVPRSEKPPQECIQCKVIKPSENFREVRRESTVVPGEIRYYLDKKCFACVVSNIPKEKADHYRKKARIRDRGIIKKWVQYRISSWRNKLDIPSDLTVEYLLNLYHEQNGNCYYTGRKLLIEPEHEPAKLPFETISLDRLIPEMGYVQGNVVWCCVAINRMKNDVPKEKFIQLLREIINHLNTIGE